MTYGRESPKSALNRAYYAAHKEELKAYKRAWRATHKEELKAYSQAYYAAHKEEFKALNRAYYAAHKEELKAYKRARRATQKDKLGICVTNSLRSYPNTSVSLRRNIVITKRLIKTLKGAL